MTEDEIKKYCGGKNKPCNWIKNMIRWN
jgi:hypothetical protein